MLRQFIRPVNLPAPRKVAASMAQNVGFIWLDGAAGKNAASFMAHTPVAKLSLSDITYNDDPFGQARDLWRHWQARIVPADVQPLPFMGGLAGLFGYGLGRAYEKLPIAPGTPSNVPDMDIGVYLNGVGFDHGSGQAYLVVCAEDTAAAEGKFTQLLADIANKTPEIPINKPVKLHLAQSEADIQAAIARIIAYIRSGDIFQANYTACYRGFVPDFDLFSAYLALRERNAAAYAAYYKGQNWALASCSPEQFLGVNAQAEAVTRPIKGTAPAALEPALLASCPKNRAENIMIVDLLRNDLSKVCVPDSVDVPSLCAVERFAHVQHLVSTVTGTLAPEKDAFALLQACFPGGSITGAPKIRAMEIIAELEAQPRGAYCGSLAYVGWDGAMDSSILIRTLVQAGDELLLQAGGGITYQSNPADELAELQLKAARILDVLNHNIPAQVAA